MEKLAELADTTQVTISNIERGTRNASSEMATRLIEAIAPPEMDEVFRSRMLRQGLALAGFVLEGEITHEPFIEELRQAGYLDNLPPATQQEIMDYIRFKSEQARGGKPPDSN